jgi:hypothetical protein
MIAAVIIIAFFSCASAFKPSSSSGFCRAARSLKMIEIELNSATYAGIFVATLIPSLAFVKFVGDSADQSKENLSEKQKMMFKKGMMETPGTNVGLPSTEEELIKKQIAKAYMQDKDVDVAVLEEKLKQRAQWRKEILAQQTAIANEDEDGW